MCNEFFRSCSLFRASKGENTFLVAVYECDVGSAFENPQYNRLYCSAENWIHNSYFPTCTSTGETDGKFALRAHYSKRSIKSHFDLMEVFLNLYPFVFTESYKFLTLKNMKHTN